MVKKTFIVAAMASFLMAASVQADTTVTLKGVHLCCGACLKAVGKTISGVDGASAKCDRKAKTVTITAGDDATAQKAVTALANAGFFGTSSSKTIAIKDDSGAKKGKVKRLELTGAHNCCGGCCKALKAAIKKVDGVEADTAKPKAASFVVEGNFDAAALIKALHAAGFHAKVKK